MTFELILTDEPDIQAELLELQPRLINPARLHADLKAALGGLVAGISTRGGQVAVLLTGIPDEVQQESAEVIVAAHNAALLTPGQQAEVQRQQAESAAQPFAVSALQGYNAAIADLTDNWASLTAGAKLEAVRAGVIVALRLARWLIARELA